MLKRAEFWFLLLIVIMLVASLGDYAPSIDINLHTTYYVIAIFHILLPTFSIYFAVIGGYAWLSSRNQQLSSPFKWTHVVISYLTTFFFLWTLFPGHQTRNYDNRDIFLIIIFVNFLLFILIQIVFEVAVVRKLLKKPV